jgi:hypothetical protein
MRGFIIQPMRQMALRISLPRACGLALLVWSCGWCVPESMTAAEKTLGGLTAMEILQKSDLMRNGSGSAVVRTRITYYKNSQVEQQSLFDVYAKGQEKALVRALDPNQRGLRILVLGDDFWMTLPDVSKPVRITPLQRLVGQASNGDVARTYYAADYTPVLLGEERVKGHNCARLELTAKRKGATYQRIIYWVSLEDFSPVQADFFLLSGKNSKFAQFEEYRDFGGQRLLARLTIYDKLVANEKTTLEYLDFKVRTIPDKYFNTNKMAEF